MSVGLSSPSAVRASVLRLVLTTDRPPTQSGGLVTHDIALIDPLLTTDGLISLGRQLAVRLCPKVFDPQVAWGHDAADGLALDAGVAQRLFADWRIHPLDRKHPSTWTPSEVLAMAIGRGLCLAVPGWEPAALRGCVRFALYADDPILPRMTLSFKRSLHPLRIINAI